MNDSKTGLLGEGDDVKLLGGNSAIELAEVHVEPMTLKEVLFNNFGDK